MAKILTASGPPVEATFRIESTWQEALKNAIRSGAELCQLLKIPLQAACGTAETDFPVFAPLEYVSRMQSGNSRDPLLLQVLASSRELDEPGVGMIDAVGDAAAERLPGLLHKYERRVLLITTGACAIHCRYCFRRHFPYSAVPKGKTGWQPALDAIAADHSLDEVILSGGDPLTLTDGALSWLVARIAEIEHIRRLRIHTRVPVVIPQRIGPELLAWVRSTRLPVYMVLHFNHPAEVDANVANSLTQLKQAGVTLLNQAVLLRDINDSLQTQCELCLKLIDNQVLPYYLHQLDPVQGALHFGVSDERAIEIARQLAEHLPGYAVPKLVREIAGQRSKFRMV
jgi:lysine 2,3-aminomutase